MALSLGDFVLYFHAAGGLEGYGIVVGRTEHWCIILDQQTGEKRHWSCNLIKKATI